jgi:hypothetical protein
LTPYDTAEERTELRQRRPVNIHRLGLLLQRLEEVEAEVTAGASLARALYDNFTGRLLTRLEKTASPAVTYGGGRADTGRPA